MNLSSNDKILQSVKSPSKLENKSQLVFVYPMLIDHTLAKYELLFRQFMTSQFINQIKISNVLNIMSSASAHSLTSIEGDSINPALSLRDALKPDRIENEKLKRLTTADVKELDLQRTVNINTRYDYQEKINSFLDYIKLQLESDPTYIELKPVISAITTENLLNIPLILGTMCKKVNSDALYWIMFISLGQNIKLNKRDNFKTIGKYMKMIPSDKYMDLLYKKTQIPSHYVTPSQGKISTIVNDTFTNVKATLISFDIFLDEERFAQEVGVLSSKATAHGTALTENEGIEKELLNRARTLFMSFLANDVLHMFQSIVNAVVSSDTVDVSSRYSHFNYEINERVEETYKFIVNYMKSGFIQSGDATQAENKLDASKSYCKDIAEIDTVRIFRNYKAGVYRLIEMPSKMLEVVSDMTLNSARLSSFSRLIETAIKNISDEPSVKQQLDSFRTDLLKLIKEFFEDATKLTPTGDIERSKFGDFAPVETKDERVKYILNPARTAEPICNGEWILDSAVRNPRNQCDENQIWSQNVVYKKHKDGNRGVVLKNTHNNWTLLGVNNPPNSYNPERGGDDLNKAVDNRKNITHNQNIIPIGQNAVFGGFRRAFQEQIINYPFIVHGDWKIKNGESFEYDLNNDGSLKAEEFPYDNMIDLKIENCVTGTLETIETEFGFNSIGKNTDFLLKFIKDLNNKDTSLIHTIIPKKYVERDKSSNKMEITTSTLIQVNKVIKTSYYYSDLLIEFYKLLYNIQNVSNPNLQQYLIDFYNIFEVHHTMTIPPSVNTVYDNDYYVLKFKRDNKQFNSNQSYGISIPNSHRDATERFENPNYNPPTTEQVLHSKRFETLTSVDVTNAAGATETISGNVTEFLKNAYNALMEYIYFVYLYCLFSYFCEYMSEIRANITAQKKDALEFPNYCLVIKSEYIQGLYMALAAKNFEELLKKRMTDFTEFNIEQSTLKAQIKAIANRLLVPNLIVVDEKKKEIWYKWMYSSDVIKIGLSTIESYIDSQKKVLRFI